MVQATKTKYVLKGEKYIPPWTDLIGYQSVLKFIIKHNILSIEGDMVEIGTFLGGGALKLSQFLSKEKSFKKIFVVDVFDPDFDWTKTINGNAMATIYQKILSQHKGKTQFEVFSEVTMNCRNLHVLKSDSKKVMLPANKLCFGLIDGNHDPEYVENDFYLVWNKLSSGGIIVFHDYEGDLPQTTKKIKELISRHSEQIESLSQEKQKWLLYLIKK